MNGFNKTSSLLGAAILAVALAPAVQASHERGANVDTFTDYARVVDAEPVYETVVSSRPVEQCWNERVRPARYDRHYRDDHSTPMLVGALLGGALGNELGHHKRNKQVGAVIGGLLGGSIARDISRQNQAGHEHHAAHNGRYQTVQRCETSYEDYEEQRLVGYEVSYRYRGKLYQARTIEHPGDRLPLRVTIAPGF